MGLHWSGWNDSGHGNRILPLGLDGHIAACQRVRTRHARPCFECSLGIFIWLRRCLCNTCGMSTNEAFQRPFVNFYGCTFILYELSSPFLNFHWFFDKLDMTGSKPQLYNGLMLLFTFFCCRLVWGTYQSVRVYQDVWRALHRRPAAATIHFDALNNTTSAALDAATGKSAAPIHDGIMQFAGEEFVPLWLAFTYLGSNVVLNTLNFYWFGKMIDAVRKRFQPPKEQRRKEKAIAAKTTGADGKVRIGVDETEVRRRRVVEEEGISAIS